MPLRRLQYQLWPVRRRQRPISPSSLFPPAPSAIAPAPPWRPPRRLRRRPSPPLPPAFSAVIPSPPQSFCEQPYPPASLLRPPPPLRLQFLALLEVVFRALPPPLQQLQRPQQPPPRPSLAPAGVRRAGSWAPNGPAPKAAAPPRIAAAAAVPLPGPVRAEMSGTPAAAQRESLFAGAAAGRTCAALRFRRVTTSVAAASVAASAVGAAGRVSAGAAAAPGATACGAAGTASGEAGGAGRASAVQRPPLQQPPHDATGAPGC